MPDRYLLLGENVSNSPTPRMMNAAFEALGLDANYHASNVKAADLRSAFAKIRDAQTNGFNVTTPHKTSIAHYLSSLDEVSSRIGAVNTARRERGLYRGYNTDVDGIVGPLKSSGLSRPKRAFVLGTGGAARAFCEAMHELGCSELVAFSRRPEGAGGFLSSMKTAFPEIKIEVSSMESPPSDGPELLFNASPAGANGIPLPKQMNRVLERGPTVFDAVYFPVRTELIKMAEKLRCRTIYGHEMLLSQAVKALQIWTGRAPPVQVMKTSLLESFEVAAD